jgi:3-isopropylmalate dehydrogenase
MGKILNLAVIGGDGIGPEVTAEAVATLRAAAGTALQIRTIDYSLEASHDLATGEVLSDETLEKLEGHDAILLGAVGGDPKDPQHAGGIIKLRLLLKLRFAFDHYVNLRPTRLLPGLQPPLANPGTIDFVVVLEGTEGPYVGNRVSLRQGTPAEVANEVSVNMAHGVQRLVKYAFEATGERRKKLSLVHKTNVLTHAGGLWSRIVNEVAAEFPGIEVDHLYIDAATIFMVTEPGRFDVIVTDNLFGDLLTDLASAVGGGIGLAASANLNPSRATPACLNPFTVLPPILRATVLRIPPRLFSQASCCSKAWVAETRQIESVRQPHCMFLRGDQMAGCVEESRLAKKSGPTCEGNVRYFCQTTPASWHSEVIILLITGPGTMWDFGRSRWARGTVGHFHDWVTPSLSFPLVAMIALLAIAAFSEGNVARGFTWH